MWENTVNIICDAEIFSAIQKEELLNVLTKDNVEIASFSSGEVIFSSENYKSAIGVILSGNAKVIKNGSDALLSVLSKGDIFGAQCLFLSKDYFTNAIIAAGQCKVAFVQKSVMNFLMANVPKIATEYIHYLSKRIYFLGRRIVNFTGGNAESRLANYLLSEAGDFKFFTLNIPLSTLSEILNMGRASLYRAFDSLTDCGAIEKQGKSIRILSKEKLISLTNNQSE